MVAHFTIIFDELMSLQKNMISTDKFHKKAKLFLSLLGLFMGFIVCLVMVGNVINASFAGILVFFSHLFYTK